MKSIKPLNSLSKSQPSCGINYGSKWAISSTESPNVISSPMSLKRCVGITIPEFLRQNLHNWQNKVAFECGLTGRKYTHGEIFHQSQSFAASLIKAGYKRQDVACIMLPNIPEFPIVALGIWEAGLIASPINPNITPDEIVKQFHSCEGKVIVIMSEQIEIVKSLMIRCPTLKQIIVIGNTDKECLSFSQMIKTDPAGYDVLKGSAINTIKETAILPYSSGTTGLPKGVELTHSTFTTNLQQLTQPGYTQLNFTDDKKPQERFLAVIPFFHMYGLQVIMAMTLYLGAHTVCLPKFNPSTYTLALKKHKPTILHIVTPMIIFINSCPDIEAKDLNELKGVMAGGAPIGVTIIHNLLAKVGHYIFFQEGFGMTEISTLCHLLSPASRNTKIGSSGVLLPGTSCKIVDLNTGENLGPNEQGEIRIDGPQVMKGYLNNEKATVDAFDSEGFLCTGDIGYYDEDGCLYIVDRLKEIIKVKGFQVAPAELENVLRQHPKIEDVAVIGVKHADFGEAPRAYVIRKDDSLTEASISAYLDGKVCGYKKLAGGIEFVDVIPKSNIGKILRRVLIQDYLSKTLSKVF